MAPLVLVTLALPARRELLAFRGQLDHKGILELLVLV